MIYQFPARLATLAVLLLASLAAAPPGVVIDHCPQTTRQYIGSPSIAILPDGRYVASHDFFGPDSGQRTGALTRVFESRDRGKSWRLVAEVQPAFWSTLFVHGGALYMMGTAHEYGNTLIRRSTDGGATWTTPSDEKSGLLLRGQYHCAPQPVLVHQGRLWRAMEDAEAGGGWGERFRAFMMSAPLDADLLNAASWTSSNHLSRDPTWLDGKFRAWLEGNAVALPDGNVADILRVDVPQGGIAAVVRISPDGRTATFDPAAGFIEFPGGAKKFTIRFDPQSRLYWALSNYVPDQFKGPRAAGIRNTLALISSPDAVHWKVRSIILQHPDVEKHGFQYPDWQFDGKDIVAAVRTAFDDESGGAHNAHDANFLTFHRIRNFRKLAAATTLHRPVHNRAPRTAAPIAALPHGLRPPA
jgi:hypothetical protein